ncbi:hypothetical protein NDU88_003750 [Pleurodeles waltl]|uniref:Uncharacterized protein n=1 Tax=Pleurodeles waltl TaxID=8319 RepID=A0AAV7WW69_PLEWA|nr:hypothetical protein NDU88_003750 [Pleurodeles waltl]
MRTLEQVTEAVFRLSGAGLCAVHDTREAFGAESRVANGCDMPFRVADCRQEGARGPRLKRLLFFIWTLRAPNISMHSLLRGEKIAARRRCSTRRLRGDRNFDARPRMNNAAQLPEGKSMQRLP